MQRPQKPPWPYTRPAEVSPGKLKLQVNWISCTDLDTLPLHASSPALRNLASLAVEQRLMTAVCNCRAFSWVAGNTALNAKLVTKPNLHLSCSGFQGCYYEQRISLWSSTERRILAPNRRCSVLALNLHSTQLSNKVTFRCWNPGQRQKVRQPTGFSLQPSRSTYSVPLNSTWQTYSHWLTPLISTYSTPSSKLQHSKIQHLFF